MPGYRSPADNGLSVGAPISVNHVGRQPGCDQWKDYEDCKSNNVRDDKGKYTNKNRRHIDVLDDALDDKDVHPHGRMNQTKFDRHDDNHAEPYRIESESTD